jgi:hypothetical protein
MQDFFIYFKQKNKQKIACFLCHILRVDSNENSLYNIQSYYDFMNNNFLEFKKYELELVENNEIYKY